MYLHYHFSCDPQSLKLKTFIYFQSGESARVLPLHTVITLFCMPACVYSSRLFTSLFSSHSPFHLPVSSPVYLPSSTCLDPHMFFVSGDFSALLTLKVMNGDRSSVRILHPIFKLVWRCSKRGSWASCSFASKSKALPTHELGWSSYFIHKEISHLFNVWTLWDLS